MVQTALLQNQLKRIIKRNLRSNNPKEELASVVNSQDSKIIFVNTKDEPVGLDDLAPDVIQRLDIQDAVIQEM